MVSPRNKPRSLAKLIGELFGNKKALDSLHEEDIPQRKEAISIEEARLREKTKQRNEQRYNRLSSKQESILRSIVRQIPIVFGEKIKYRNYIITLSGHDRDMFDVSITNTKNSLTFNSTYFRKR
jgi:hypothetical protein